MAISWRETLNHPSDCDGRVVLGAGLQAANEDLFGIRVSLEILVWVLTFLEMVP